MRISGYKAMWLFVTFDLPVKEKIQRKRATQFRKFLLKDGFIMLQYSVYSRPCPSQENTAVHFQRVKKMLPPEGQVRILKITDKQFEKMQVYYGKKQKKPETMPQQLELF